VPSCHPDGDEGEALECAAFAGLERIVADHGSVVHAADLAGVAGFQRRAATAELRIAGMTATVGTSEKRGMAHFEGIKRPLIAPGMGYAAKRV
jgi:hypothetical protein